MEDQLFDEWFELREQGDIRPNTPQAIRLLGPEFLQNYITCYLNAFEKSQTASALGCYDDVVYLLKEGFKKLLLTSGPKDADGQPAGAYDFVKLMHDMVYRPLYDVYEENLRNRMGGQKSASDARLQAMLTMLRLPNDHFPTWNRTFFPRLAQAEKVVTGQKTVLVTTAKRQPGKGLTVGGDKKKKLLKISSAATNEYAETTGGGPFEVRARSYGISAFKEWDDSVLLFRPKELFNVPSQYYLAEIAKQTLTMLALKVPSVDDLVLLKQQARFWLDEFFNNVVLPCTFAAPNLITSRGDGDVFAAYRLNVMPALFTLSFFLERPDLVLEGGRNKAAVDYLKRPIMTEGEWRQYMSMNFPQTAMVLFDEVPGTVTLTSDAAKEAFQLAKRVAEETSPIIPTLQKMQDLLIVKPAPTVAIRREDQRYPPLAVQPRRRTDLHRKRTDRPEEEEEKGFGPAEESVPSIEKRLKPAVARRKWEAVEMARSAVKNAKPNDKYVSITLPGLPSNWYDKIEMTNGELNGLLSSCDQLNDNVTSSFVALLNSVFYKKQTLIIRDSHTLSSFMSADEAKRQRIVDSFKEQFNGLIVEKIVVLVNIPSNDPLSGIGGHWCTFVLDLNEKRYEVYDSLLMVDLIQPYLLAFRKLIGALQDNNFFTKDFDEEFMAGIDEEGIEVGEEWSRVVTHFPEPLQKDGVSCGAFALLFAQGVAQDLNDWTAFERVSSLDARELVAQQLLTARLLDLEEQLERETAA